MFGPQLNPLYFYHKGIDQVSQLESYEASIGDGFDVIRARSFAPVNDDYVEIAVSQQRFPDSLSNIVIIHLIICVSQKQQ